MEILSTFAVCPICTVAVGAGLAVSEWLGIDDVVASIWIGGLLMSLTIWTVNWLVKKQWSFKGDWLVSGVAWYGLTLGGLWWSGSLFKAGNVVFGLDKILVGTVVGSLVFLAASQAYQYLKKKNNDKAHFPFEKVVLPVAALAITSLIAYFLTKS